MFYEHPNLKQLLGYPFLAWVVSLGITGNVPAGEWRELARFGYVAVCVNLALVPSFFLAKQFQEQAYSNKSDAPVTPVNDRPVKADTQLIPHVTSGGTVINSQVVQGVKFHKVRKDARPNSPYIIRRWDIVQAVARGNERVLNVEN